MGIDVMLVAGAEDVASRPSDKMMDWLERRFEDFDIRYGCISVDSDAAQELVAKFGDDPVGAMLAGKIEQMKASGVEAPYVIELMIGW